MIDVQELHVLRTRPRKATSVRYALKSLGLKKPQRWETVKVLLRDRIVQARRNGDDDTARAFSQLKYFLKNNLYRTCRLCGNAVSPGPTNICGAHGRRNDKS